MRFLCIFLIRCYQIALSPLKRLLPGHPLCRFDPTCSNYGIAAFRAHGALKGGALTIRRIFRCHPWGEFGFDPVPGKVRWKHLAGFFYSADDAMHHALSIHGAVLSKNGRHLAEGSTPSEAIGAALRSSRGTENSRCFYCHGKLTHHDLEALREARVSEIVLANAPDALTSDALQSSGIAVQCGHALFNESHGESLIWNQ